MAKQKDDDRSPEELIEAFAKRATTISVFGPFNAQTLVMLPADLAGALFGEPLALTGGVNVVEAAERDIEAIRERDSELADSTLAATAIRLAQELEHPFNSATSKSMCAARLIEALDRLRELAPQPEEDDKLDELRAKRAERLKRQSKAAS